MSDTHDVDSVIVSISINKETGTSVMSVCRPSKNGQQDVINVFANDEAMDLYNKLFIPAKDGKLNRAMVSMYTDPPTKTLH